MRILEMTPKMGLACFPGAFKHSGSLLVIAVMVLCCRGAGPRASGDSPASTSPKDVASTHTVDTPMPAALGGVDGGNDDVATLAAGLSPERTSIEQLAQRTLDLPELQQYFHVQEIPSRSPLFVLDNQVIDPGFLLTKFGKPVIFRDPSDVERGDPVFEFESIDIRADSARVGFRYRVEGIRGHADFQWSGDEGWVANRVALKES